MDVRKICLTREDVKAIVEAMDKFPDAVEANLMYEENPDGDIKSLGVHTMVNGLMGHFIIQIAKEAPEA
jgi:hypothetical protein